MWWKGVERGEGLRGLERYFFSSRSGLAFGAILASFEGKPCKEEQNALSNISEWLLYPPPAGITRGFFPHSSL